MHRFNVIALISKQKKTEIFGCQSKYRVESCTQWGLLLNKGGRAIEDMPLWPSDECDGQNIFGGKIWDKTEISCVQETFIVWQTALEHWNIIALLE